MRWFFLILLIVNILYVAWELNRERSIHTVTAALPKDVERIVLLSELEKDAGQKAAVEKTGDAPASLAEPTTKITDASPPGPAEQSQRVEAAEEEETTIAAVMEQDADADSPETTDETVPSARAPVAEPAADLCYTLGPFREMDTLRVVIREIKDYVIEASFRSKEEQEQSMFRVLLKPVGSKREAKALTKQLVSKNIRDYYIITEGSYENGISLGYFSSKGRAERHGNRVRKAGFDAIVEPVFKTYTIYWLDYRIEAGHQIPPQIFEKHLESTTQRLSRSCD